MIGGDIIKKLSQILYLIGVDKMIDGLFLSEAIDIKDLYKNKLNLIKTNCGSGKTYFALNDLAKTASSLSHVVYLTDTVAMRDALSKKDNCKIYEPSDRKILNGEKINFTENKIIVMTYQKMGMLLKYQPNLFDAVEIIICDEIHKIPEYIEIERRKNKKRFPCATKEEQDFWITCSCSCYLTATYIEQMASGIKINSIGDVEILDCPKLVVGLSATPKRAIAFFSKIINEIRINAQTVAYETFKTIYYTDLASTIRNLDTAGQVLFYVPFIRDINKSVEISKQMGRKAIGIWSLSNEKYPMNEEQKRVREYILTNESLPPEYEHVYINQACETAINIRGDIQIMVIHSTDQDKRTQARNRFRGDLEVQYLLANQQERCSIKVPIEFLETYLDKEKKQQLCEYMNFRNDAGSKVGWTTTKRNLIAAGYKIEDKRPRINGKQTSCSIIYCND